MEKTIEYYPRGVCSKRFDLVLDGDVIRSVRIEGGCDGNSQGLMRLLPGMRAEDVIDRLSGVSCECRPTSCPDQIAQALKKLMDD